jgi:hypothetical protein
MTPVVVFLSDAHTERWTDSYAFVRVPLNFG